MKLSHADSAVKIVFPDQEMIDVAQSMQLDAIPLPEADAMTLIGEALSKFRPQKVCGHLAIGEGSMSLSVDDHELTFHEKLGDGRVFVFFDQCGPIARSCVSVRDGASLGKLLEECSGFEYFIVGEGIDYLVSVNWYVIQGTGSVTKWMADVPGVQEG